MASGIYLVSLGIIYLGTQSQSWLLLAETLTAQLNAMLVVDYVIICTDVMTCATIT